MLDGVGYYQLVVQIDCVRFERESAVYIDFSVEICVLPELAGHRSFGLSQHTIFVL